MGIKLEITGTDSLKRLANAIEESFRLEVNLKGLEPDIESILSEQNQNEFATETSTKEQHGRITKVKLTRSEKPNSNRARVN